MGFLGDVMCWFIDIMVRLFLCQINIVNLAFPYLLLSFENLGSFRRMNLQMLVFIAFAKVCNHSGVLQWGTSRVFRALTWLATFIVIFLKKLWTLVMPNLMLGLKNL